MTDNTKDTIDAWAFRAIGVGAVLAILLAVAGGF
jgi:hypothetical protein